jgi:hypothetical protein
VVVIVIVVSWLVVVVIIIIVLFVVIMLTAIMAVIVVVIATRAPQPQPLLPPPRRALLLLGRIEALDARSLAFDGYDLRNAIVAQFLFLARDFLRRRGRRRWCRCRRLCARTGRYRCRRRRC